MFSPNAARHSLRILVTLALALLPLPMVAQPDAAKPRLELADSARRPATPDAANPLAPPQAPGFRADFVRNQTLLGVGLYAPAFATAVARDGVAWGAGYLLVAGGSFVAAAEISRSMTITDPMQYLATWAPLQGAIAGSMLGGLVDGDAKSRAAAILAGSLGGTAMALWRGRDMNEGEAAATLTGASALGLVAFGASTAMGVSRENASGASNKTRLAVTLGGMLAGAPLGHAYAARAPYHVSRGDLTAMGAAAGVGMLAGITTIADIDDPTDRQVAGALTLGGIAGLVVGDRLLTKRYDHTPGEGRLVVMGAMAGALMGSGVALVIRGQDATWGTLTAGLATVGAAGGIALSQRYAAPKADGAVALGGLTLNPAGLVAVASGVRGTYMLGSIRF